MTKLHHATIAKAAKLGFEILPIPGDPPMFKTVSLKSRAESVAVWVSTKEIFDFVAKEDIAYGEPPLGKSNKSGVMVLSYHKLYTKNGGGCGDILDQALRDLLVTETGVDTALLRRVAEANGLWTDKWEGLNPGMQRMNLANRMRGMLRNNADATVDLDAEGKGRFEVAYEPSTKMVKAAARAQKALMEPKGPAAPVVKKVPAKGPKKDTRKAK